MEERDLDEGIFWGMLAVDLLLTFAPLALKGQKWALLSFVGFLFGLIFENTLTSDAAIVVGYSTNGANVSNINNGIGLEVALLTILALVSVLITAAKALDKI